MEHAMASAPQQQQSQQQNQFMLLQQQIQQHNQQQAIPRFPSSNDAHLRPPTRSPINTSFLQSHLRYNPNPNSNPLPLNQMNPSSSNSQHFQQQQQAANRVPPDNWAELELAHQDAWLVCHPDFKRPFSSLEDACQRLVPYHVVADYEADEDDRILDSDTTGQLLSRSQQWDHNVAAKVAEFTATFEKQVNAFNIINRKRKNGEFRSEEQLMVEQALLQEEKRALLEAREEMESRHKAGQEAQPAYLRMAAMAHAEQARVAAMAHAEQARMATMAHVEQARSDSQANEMRQSS